MSDNLLPVVNVSTTHNEDRNIADFSKLTAKSRFENFENHQQVLKNYKQEVKETVELHYNDITKVIDGKEIKNHVGDKEVEHKGVKIITHNGDSTKVQNGDRIEILNGKKHETHFGNHSQIIEGHKHIVTKGDYTLETINLETKVENNLKTCTKHLHTEVLEDQITNVKGNSSCSVEGDYVLKIEGDKKETIEKDTLETVKGTKRTEIYNLCHCVKNDSVTEVGKNSVSEVKGNVTNVVLRNKSEFIHGTSDLNSGNHFRTIQGVDKKVVLHDESVKVHGNKTVNVDGTIVEHSNKNLQLSSDETLTLNGQEKKLIGGYTVIDTLVLTSPNGTHWGIVTDNEGNLKTAVMSDI